MSLSDLIISNAQKTPYFHLDGYMNRWWFIKSRKWYDKVFGGARVHQILRSDSDRHLHDHPWPYCTIILKGGYTEVTANGKQKWYGPGSVLFRGSKHFHRLIVPDGQEAWTLFITGPYTHGWGFKIPWREYVGEESTKQTEEEYMKHFGSVKR